MKLINTDDCLNMIDIDIIDRLWQTTCIQLPTLKSQLRPRLYVALNFRLASLSVYMLVMRKII